MISRKQSLFYVLCGFTLLFACQKDTDFAGSIEHFDRSDLKSNNPQVDPETILDLLNVQLAAQGENYRARRAEYIGTGDTEGIGITVLAKDVGNKQLTEDFIPFDSRRTWSPDPPDGTDAITYAIDSPDAIPAIGGLSAAETEAAIERAMATWDEINCSDIDLIRNPDFGADIGAVAWLNGFGGSPFIFADIQHAGFHDIDFAGGVIGATFTFVFVDDEGNPTDLDNNGKLDVIFREIYYDPSFPWSDDGTNDVDVETIALHEAGHGLSQGHFGSIKLNKNGSVKASPRAVMNALYIEPLRELKGTDHGGHCSNWGSWPNN